MNIFYTDRDPIQAARNLCRIHRNKMLIEYCQLLSTAHHVLDGEQALSGIYRLTHINHPSSVFARSSVWAYEWVLDSATELSRLYTEDTGKVHACQAKLELLQTLPNNIVDRDWQDPPVAAPDEFKKVAIFKGAVSAYREYIKAKYIEWQQKERPLKVDFYKYTPEWL